MASGWEAFGGVLGGGIDRTGAFEQGRLRTAQTESAIQQAQERQLKNIAAEAQAAAIERVRRTEAAAGIDQVPLADIMESGYGNFDQVMGGRLKGQEHGFRETLADPEAAGADRFLAGQGVQGKVLNPFDMVGGAEYVDLRNPDAGLEPTALGDSLIDENVAQTAAANALADQRQRTPAGGGAAPWTPGKPPSGYVLNPEYDPSQPIGEGNYPYLEGRPPVTGSREHQMNQRMVRSAAQIVPDIANLLTMPANASLGVLGTGSAPGASMLQASVDALRNTVAPAVVRAYTAQTGEIGKAMAFIESNGFVPNQALLDQAINAYSIRPGDTGFDVLRKFANLRQNIEQFNLVQQADERVPADIRKLLAELTAVTARSVPFTVQQVNELQFGANRTRTMADLMREHGFNPEIGTTPGGGQPGAQSGAPAAPAAPAADEVWERGPDGKLRRVQ